MAEIRPGNEFASWTSIQPSEVGQAIKSGLMAYGMKQSGLTDFLDNLSKSKQPNIPGAVQPFTGISNQGQLAAVPQPPQEMNWGAMMPSPQAPAGAVAPGATVAPTVAPQPTMPSPQEIGMDWLNGKLSKFNNISNMIGSMLG